MDHPRYQFFALTPVQPSITIAVNGQPTILNKLGIESKRPVHKDNLSTNTVKISSLPDSYENCMSANLFSADDRHSRLDIRKCVTCC